MPVSLKRVSLASTAVLIGTLVLSASPGAAGPADPKADRQDKLSLSEVRDRLETLDHQAEIASEDLNAVRVQMQAAQKRAQTLQADVDRKRNRVEKLRSVVVGTALSDYQSAGGLSTTTSFLIADDPGEFMDGVATKAMVEHEQSGLLTKLTQQQRQLDIREQQAQVEIDAIRQDKIKERQHHQVLDDRVAEAQDLLDSLKAQQLERLRKLQEAQAAQAAARVPTTQPSTAPEPSRSAPRVLLGSVPASSRAQIAVQTALAQVGDPYVYGAVGPNSFDCSGLTMYAWAAAGVSLPHASSMQPGAGTPVSISALAPGDLVFYYSPISHVGMYIGNGQVVHAPHPGSYVEVVPLYSMPVTMAVRVG